MTELVLLVPPQVMRVQVCEPELRSLFEKHKYSNAKTVDAFLSSKSISYETELGINENGGPLLSYTIDGQRLFAIKSIN